MKIARPISLTADQLIKAAEALDCSCRCFYQFSTGEIKELIDRNDPYYDPIDAIEEQWKELEANEDDYTELYKMSSGQAFDVMEDFLDEVEDPLLKARLLKALSRSKPFRNFKNEIDESEYRDSWFKFKEKKTIEWLQTQLKEHG